MDKQHHIDLKPGDAGRYVLLPGDPGRTELIASYFDDAKEIAYKREYRTFTGTLLGEKVTVTSTGIGCPSAAIAIEELIAIGADTFIRVGTSGGIQPDTINGEVAVINAAIRDEGTTLHYMPVEFPAVADLDVTLALRKAAQDLELPHRVGVSQTKDSFYGQHAPKRMPVANRLLDRWKAWTDGGAICSEMEAAVLLVIGNIHRVRVGGVMLMGKFEKLPETPEELEVFSQQFDINKPIRVAVEALKTLIEADRAKSAS
ncbi:MAG: nucleoside phosphorylase [Anaerolineales bacterium]|nr:nucleoside phosphorylase [Anaerolineales bacterium]